jgi:hypothetical protein
MKTQLFKSLLLIGLIVLVLSGCNQNPSNKQTKGQEVASFDTVAFRNRIADLIRQSPKGIATYDVFKKIGVSYINGLPLSISNADKFETKQEMAMAIGAYTADMNYSVISMHPDRAAQGGEVVTRLMSELGIQKNMPKTSEYFERLAKNADNQDSVAAFVEMAMKVYHQEQNANSPEIYPLIFVGGNVEILYLLTQLTLYSGTKPELIECLSKQDDLAKTMLSLLEVLSTDEAVKPYVEKMKPIVAYFDEHPDFTEKELKEIAPMIETIRNDMFQ